MRQIVTDENVLEKEDAYILDRIKDFAATVEKEVTPPIPAAKQLIELVIRAVSTVFLGGNCEHYLKFVSAKWWGCDDQADSSRSPVSPGLHSTQIHERVEAPGY